MTDPLAARRWLLIALIFVAIALNYVDRQVLALLKPTLEAAFSWSNRDYALLGSAFQVTAAISFLFVGYIVDRFGVRRALGWGVALWSLAGIAHAFSTSVGQFVAARIALAAAETVGTPAAVKSAAVYLPLRQRSLALGLGNTAPNIGAIVTPLLIPPLALAFGWQAAFIVTGALGFVWLIFWIGGTRGLTPVADQGAAEGARVPLGELIRDRRSWAIIGAKFFSDLCWFFLLFWIPDFFGRQFGMSQATLGGPVALIYSLAALGALSSGLLFPRLVARGLSVNRARKSSMLFYALMILPMPLAILAPGPWVAAFVIGIALFAHQGFSTNIFGLAADAIPAGRVATVIGAGAVAGNLSGAGMIELAGWSIDHGLGYWPMFAVCASAYLVATLWVHLLVPVIRPAQG
ncbi:MFS transporter [Sphingomonas changnyeongensis]|uniref:MFS transporter n=1 Tax=Sphingomonas changnyeongensis TaxID=2698679 RepID=A0A7Z2S6I5_9SPHN|nr:MFS transporter [Sphingomonas changnyeongensis]QHL91543.1 MFS transporter [Sphingomonas changnyeongensis]